MKDDLHTQLQTAFAFTPDDLHANRNGQLTPQQQEQLKANLFPYWKIVGMTIVVVLIGTALVIPGIAFSPDMFVGIETLPAAFAILVLLAVVFLGVVFWLRRKVYARIRDGQVTVLEGRLKVIPSDMEGGGGRFQVRKQTFNDLTPEQFDLVSHISEIYDRPKVTIYHVPGHYKVLSMELSQTQ